MLLLFSSPYIAHSILHPSDRYYFANAFPRLVRHHQLLTMSIVDNTFSTGWEVSGSLSLIPSVVTIEIIAFEWAEWSLALSFVSIKPL